MREIVFKNFTSQDSRIKNISATEILRHDKMLVESSRDTKYLIHRPIEHDQKTLRNFSLNKPQIYILKHLDAETNTKKFAWKIKGKMLAKYNDKIFPIDFEHSFSLEIVNLKKQFKKGEVKWKKKNI